MITELHTEFRKVFSIRSTYVILAVMLGLLIFFSFYVGGWHSDKIDLHNHFHLMQVARQGINFLAIFPGLIGLLLLTHEYRYNLIAYSLSLSNKRSKVLAAKIMVITLISVTATAFVGTFAPLLANWGIQANHLHLAHQSFFYANLTWRGLFYGWGYAMAGLVIATLIKNQIGAIVTLFIVPVTVEGLLSIWLKNNTDYLPFSSLHATLGAGLDSAKATLTPSHALLVFLSYLIVGWAVAWYLFVRRDAL